MAAYGGAPLTHGTSMTVLYTLQYSQGRNDCQGPIYYLSILEFWNVIDIFLKTQPLRELSE